MKKVIKAILRLIYLSGGLALSAFISFSIVESTLEHKVQPEKESTEISKPFPDYFKLLSEYYDNFERRKSHFHSWSVYEKVDMKLQDGCITCHSPFPHQKNKKSRAFNNQHYRFLSCLSCHLNDSLRKVITYRWEDFGLDVSTFEKGRYGLYRNEENVLSGSKNYTSRIIPVLIVDSQITPLYRRYDDELYREYRTNYDHLTPTEKEEYRRRAEEKVGKKALFCDNCHLPESRFPWSKLNFSAIRIEELTHSAIVGMVLKYEPFHFPPIYE